MKCLYKLIILLLFISIYSITKAENIYYRDTIRPFKITLTSEFCFEKARSVSNYFFCKNN